MKNIMFSKGYMSNTYQLESCIYPIKTPITATILCTNIVQNVQPYCLNVGWTASAILPWWHLIVSPRYALSSPCYEHNRDMLSVTWAFLPALVSLLILFIIIFVWFLLAFHVSAEVSHPQRSVLDLPHLYPKSV